MIPPQRHRRAMSREPTVPARASLVYRRWRIKKGTKLRQTPCAIRTHQG
jgi:hypothetical protein